MEELKNMKKLGTFQTYLDKFEELMNKVYLSEEYIVSYFLGGLKDEIRYIVRMFGLKNLQQTVSLAKLQEIAVEAS